MGVGGTPNFACDTTVDNGHCGRKTGNTENLPPVESPDGQFPEAPPHSHNGYAALQPPCFLAAVKEEVFDQEGSMWPATGSSPNRSPDLSS
jgi:hypothetical protein